MDTTLKQRLIGAIVLIALAVIFLPMLIKGPAPDSGVSDVSMAVPEAPSGQYETRELPLVTPGDAPADGALGMKPLAEPADADAAAAPATGTTDAATADAAAPAAAESMQPATAAGGDYAVSFGAYATIADADTVIARLRQSNLPGFREAATIGGKTADRVRIGPYADRAQAEIVRQQAVKVRGDVNASIITLDAAAATPVATPAPAPVTTAPLPPSQPAPSTAQPPVAATAAKPTEAAKPPAPKPEIAKPQPTAGNVGFAVQLGAFSKAADANALRDKLRAAGFSAFVEQIRTDKGALSRVRVGPVADRAEADRLKAQVAAKTGISGMVRPHP